MSGKGIFLAGYNVEDKTICSEFLPRVIQAHEEFDAPFTAFALGSCVAYHQKLFATASSHPLVDIGQHTWSHVPLKSIAVDDGKTIEFVRGGSLDQIEEEIERANLAIGSVCGEECIGLSGPWCYYRGLMDRPDLLEIVHRTGIRFVRTFGRNSSDYFPVSLDQQPFFYEPSGFPDILECMSHGWQDSYLRARLGWDDTQAYLEHCKDELVYCADRNLVYSWGAHDWSSMRDDPMLSIVRGMLRHARALGMQIVSYRSYWVHQTAVALPKAA